MGMGYGTYIDLKLSAVLLCLALCEVVAAEPDCEAKGAPADGRRAEQKIMLLERLVGGSGPARRVDASDNSEAKEALATARASAASARQDWQSGCYATAEQQATSGLSLASDAFRMAKDKAQESAGEYEALRQRARSFLQTLEAQPAEIQGIGEDDLVGIRRQLEFAEEQAAKGNFSNATEMLLPVADRLQRRLVAILDQRTIYYERHFSGPNEEFDYLLEQYRGYRLLLTGANIRDSMPFNRRSEFDARLLEAEALKVAAESLAAAGDWLQAMDTVGRALSECEEAIRLSGVYY